LPYNKVVILSFYYAGAGIHPNDFEKSELKKLFNIYKNNETNDHGTCVSGIFILTMIVTPIFTPLIFAPLFAFGLISSAWFAVIIINFILPITSTNMFLLPIEFIENPLLTL